MGFHLFNSTLQQKIDQHDNSSFSLLLSRNVSRRLVQFVIPAHRCACVWGGGGESYVYQQKKPHFFPCPKFSSSFNQILWRLFETGLSNNDRRENADIAKKNVCFLSKRMLSLERCGEAVEITQVGGREDHRSFLQRVSSTSST